MRTPESVHGPIGVDVDVLRSVLQSHPVRLAILFGSQATGETHGASDIDIAVVFESVRPSQEAYNKTFLSLSADLSRTLETDAVDLVDLRTASSSVLSSVFEDGILLVGDPEDVTTLREQLDTPPRETPSPRERMDRALANIDAHLEGQSRAPARGDANRDG